MTRVHQESMINLHHKGVLTFVTKRLYFLAFFPITCCSNHHKLYTIWKLKISKFILWKPFWNQTLLYHRNGTSQCFSGLLPLSGGVILQNVLRSFRIKTFIILTKYISLERSESQDSIFCCRCNIEREMDRFVTEMHQKNFNGVWMAPGGCFWYNA